jgi:hypothetical protein
MASKKKKLLTRVREAIRLQHYSLRTEKAYVNWIRRYILFHNKQHPKNMGAQQIEAFLTNLAVDKKWRLPHKTRHSALYCFFIVKC